MEDISRLFAFVLTSSVRLRILRALENGPARPVEIARETGIKQPNVSPVLASLVKKGLVQCLTPEKAAWRVFEITAAGREVLEKFDMRESPASDEGRPVATQAAEKREDYRR